MPTGMELGTTMTLAEIRSCRLQMSVIKLERNERCPKCRSTNTVMWGVETESKIKYYSCMCCMKDFKVGRITITP